MELQTARQIIDTLAQGIHPLTGEAMPEDSPYNAPPVIRALFTVSQALEPAPPAKRRVRPQPVNAGKSWTEDDDAILLTGHAQGDDYATIADALGRTAFSIEQRLVKLGKVESPGGARYR